MNKAINPNGDGRACQRIIDILFGKDIDPYSNIQYN